MRILNLDLVFQPDFRKYEPWPDCQCDFLYMNYANMYQMETFKKTVPGRTHVIFGFVQHQRPGRGLACSLFGAQGRLLGPKILWESYNKGMK